MRVLTLSLFLFGSLLGSTQAHANWFGPSAAAKPGRTPGQAMPAPRHTVAASSSTTTNAHLAPGAGEPSIEERVEGKEHMGPHRDRIVAVLENSFEQLQQIVAAGSWHARQRAMPGYRQCRREADRALREMDKASTPEEKEMFHRRAAAAYELAMATLEIRFDGLDGPDRELHKELASMNELGSMIGGADVRLGHVRVRTASGTQGPKAPVLSNTLNRTAAQISFMPPPVAVGAPIQPL